MVLEIHTLVLIEDVRIDDIVSRWNNGSTLAVIGAIVEEVAGNDYWAKGSDVVFVIVINHQDCNIDRAVEMIVLERLWYRYGRVK